MEELHIAFKFLYIQIKLYTMKKFLFFSVLCLLLQVGFSQSAKISYVHTNKCAVEGGAFSVITLTDASVGTVQSRVWTIEGTPNIYTDPTFTYAFTSPGTYKIVLAVTFSTGVKKDSITVEVYPMPVFSLAKGDNSICPGGSIPFSYSLAPQTTSTITGYVWEFGDGGISTDMSPSHKYDNNLNEEINYTVSLTLTDDKGCRAKVDSVDFVHVRSKPEVDFVTDKSYFCFVTSPIAAVANFTNYTDTAAKRSFAQNSYEWKFGDGNSLTQPYPASTVTSHTYGAAGMCFPKLIAIDQFGCKDSLAWDIYSAIRVTELKLDYTVSDTLVCSLPDTVIFKGNVSGLTYRWRISTLGHHNDQVGITTPVPFRKTDIGHHIVRLTITDDSDPNNPCSVTDSFRIRVYDKTPSTILANDTNECDPAHEISFANNTVYPWADDYGKAVTNWDFGDGNNTNNQHTTTHTYAGYGDYRARMTGTTPYGCPMDTAYQWIHIFRMKAAAKFIVPDPQQGPPHGCRIELDYSALDTAGLSNPNAPDSGHYVQLQNVEDSLVSSSDIVTYTWWWDYFGQHNGYDTTYVDVATSGDPFAPIPHIYGDTGVYEIYMTLRNEQGCEHTVPVQVVMVGYPPLADFTFTPDTNCKSDIQIRVFAYDSLDEHGNLVARSWADAWSWLDENDSPLANGDTATVQPNVVGPAFFKLQASHNGCNAEYIPEESSGGWVCPPVAVIDDPKEDPPGTPIVYCTFSEITNPFKHKSQEQGAIYLRWYKGDSDRTGDTANQSRSPLMVYDTLTQKYSWDSTGWVKSVPFGYQPGVVIKNGEDGNYGFTYDTGSYLFANNGLVEITLWAANDSSAMPVERIVVDTNISGRDTQIVIFNMNEPWGNYCGYCEHTAKQKVYISYAKMNFTVSQPTICQRDSVVFYDSTESNVGIFGWGFIFDSAAYPFRSDFPIGAPVPISNYTPSPQYGNGATVKFRQTNRYRAVLIDTCGFGCIRMDTLIFDVHPRSIPGFISSTDSIIFNKNRDTICANNNNGIGGYLYLQDKSTSLPPFDTAEITEWEWTVGSETSTDKDPALLLPYADLYDLSLKITNEYGCTSDSLFYDQVLVNKIYPHFKDPGDRYGIGSICNKAVAIFDVSGTQVLQIANNEKTCLEYKWDWGDGDTSIYYTTANVRVDGSHAYDLPDTNMTHKVTVRLTVTIVDLLSHQPKGCSAEYVDTIIVTRPIAKFTTDQYDFACPQDEQGILGRRLRFYDQSQGDIPITTLRWNFGDPASGSANTMAGPPTDTLYSKPYHNYLNAGVYDVLLVIQDENRCIDSAYGEQSVVIMGPRGSVTYAPTDSCAPLTVTFTFPGMDTLPVQYRPDSVVVTTDGGSNLTRVRTYPFHSTFTYYTTAGKYVPYYTLYKTVMIGTQEEICKVEFMGKDTIYTIEINPTFNTENLYCPGIPVTFENTTTYGPPGIALDAVWTFNNEDTVYTYDEAITQFDVPGRYEVNLKVSRGEKCSRSGKKTIQVMEFPVVAFTPDSADACDGLIVRFEVDSLTELDKSRIVRYDWTFSDGETFSRGKDTNWIERDFSVSDNYTYQLRLTFISDSAGCTQDYSGNVKINAFVSPTAAFVATPQHGQVGEEFIFDASSSTQGDGVLKQWIWDYNDDSDIDSLTKESTTHSYNISGERFVLLTIIDEYGCFDTIRERITVADQIHFGNVFTPDGNCTTGKCVFRPLDAKGTFAEFRMEVYDKWGMRIWRNSCEDNSNKGTCPNYDGDDFWWDGTNAQGSPVPAGVYYWVVYTKSSLAEGKPHVLNGSVTIFR